MNNSPSVSPNRKALRLLINTSVLVLTASGLSTGCSSNGGPKNDAELNAASSKVEYDSNQLMMKSADEIGEIVRKKIKKAQAIQAQQSIHDDEAPMAENGALRQLKDATRIVLARPDQDGTRAAAFSNLRREMQDLNSVELILNDLSQEGIAALKSNTTATRRQATYLVLLENMIAELRPEAGTNPHFKQILVNIRDANLRLNDQLRSQALLNSMSKPVSPSETAKGILDRDFPADKKKR